MSNSKLPISKKSPNRIAQLATAKSRRISKGQSRKFTWLWDELKNNKRTELEGQFVVHEEVGVILFSKDEQNWTALTSHQIFGSSYGASFQLEISRIDDYDFGMFKGQNVTIGTLKLITNSIEQNIPYELNSAGLMLRYSLDIIHNHWKRGAVKD